MSDTAALQSQATGWNVASSGDTLQPTNPDLGVKDAQKGDLVFQPGPHHEQRLAALQQVIEQGGNPFLEASTVLLRTLAELPDELEDVGVPGLHTLLVQELQTFTRLCEQTNLRREHMLAVRYVLCTALDEAINLKSWGGGDGNSTGMWSTRALLNHFHGESEGGRTVFLLIGRLANAPQEHMPVLEVLHHVLSLGFMGSYRMQADGHRVLETVRHRLYAMVAATHEPVPRELAMRWQGVGQGRFKLLRSVPVWVSASVLGLALFTQFGWYKYGLLVKTGAVQKSIEALVTLQPPLQPRDKLNLTQLLKTEIAQGRVRVDETAQRSRIVFKGDGMFSGGLDQLSPATLKVLNKVADALSQVDGRVRVQGHTDNQPISSSKFASNQELSQKRAQAVVAVLQAQGVDAARMEAIGLGDTQPLADNASPAGRAQNRRVEIELITAAPDVIEETASGTK
ncbi:type VI secretion system protein TssL, long form [Curvibacter sp. CHRR-16]|uniref:type VI secretion system protein TssL, long form n=1 Tax=Curvibacter sp. CHRR-16 TaxID=2835872 RepID=UPI001BDAC532|nr:type VI secretion system protein TssL, long form [Curvibacter sp. CHRR-16]MBT0571844.1 type VI secretion system protein TssL, long form [Curvibacter sp. CHRR-16]